MSPMFGAIADAGEHELAEGEIYMICQGAGGGYGDVLEREPLLVLKDVEENLLSPGLAEDIYRVVMDHDTLILDELGTERARAAEREARKLRGRPFDEFCAAWLKPEPTAELPSMGSWGDRVDDVIATPPGEPRYRKKASEMTGILISNPKDRRIHELEAEVALLKGLLEP
ncbi:MAG: hypothetical protein O3C28_08855 [Proteobacteria bacterium]|nr:hypothetical protein [Pseudomonadota bacterium]